MLPLVGRRRSRSGACSAARAPGAANEGGGPRRGPPGGELLLGGGGPARAPRGTPPSWAGPDPRLLLSCTCCAGIRGNSPTASGRRGKDLLRMGMGLAGWSSKRLAAVGPTAWFFLLRGRLAKCSNLERQYKDHDSSLGLAS